MLFGCVTLECDRIEVACTLCGQFSIVRSLAVLIGGAAAHPVFPAGGSESGDKFT